MQENKQGEFNALWLGLSEKLKAEGPLVGEDMEMVIKSMEVGVAYADRMPEKVRAQAVFANAAGAVPAPEKVRARSPEPSNRFATSNNKITREEQEALEQGYAHPPLWAREGHLTEYGNRCGRDCGCCKGLGASGKPGPFCKICRKEYDLKLFTEMMGVKEVKKMMEEAETTQLLKVARGEARDSEEQDAELKNRLFEFMVQKQREFNAKAGSSFLEFAEAAKAEEGRE